MTYKEKHAELKRKIIEFLQDENISDLNKKLSALNFMGVLVYNTASNPIQGEEMFKMAFENYIEFIDEQEQFGLN